MSGFKNLFSSSYSRLKRLARHERFSLLWRHFTGWQHRKRFSSSPPERPAEVWETENPQQGEIYFLLNPPQPFILWWTNQPTPRIFFFKTRDLERNVIETFYKMLDAKVLKFYSLTIAIVKAQGPIRNLPRSVMKRLFYIGKAILTVTMGWHWCHDIQHKGLIRDTQRELHSA